MSADALEKNSREGRKTEGPSSTNNWELGGYPYREGGGKSNSGNGQCEKPRKEEGGLWIGGKVFEKKWGPRVERGNLMQFALGAAEFLENKNNVLRTVKVAQRETNRSKKCKKTRLSKPAAAHNVGVCLKL